MDLQVIMEIRNSEESVDPGEKITLLIDKIAHLKKEVKSYLKEGKIDIEDIVSGCEDKLEKSTELIEEITICQNHIEGEALQDILNSTQELQEISFNLEETLYGLSIIEQLVTCDIQLKIFHQLKRDNKLHGAVTALSVLTDLLNNPVEGLEALGLFKILKTDLVLCWEQLLNDLSELWVNYLHWSDVILDDKRTITIKFNNTAINDKSEVLDALIASKQIHMEMKNFASFLLKHVMNPLIHVITEIDYSPDDAKTLTIIIPLNNKTVPHYEVVLNNLKILFQYLNTNLDYVLPDGNTLLRLLGSLVCVDFSDILIKDCLVHTIPNCISELQDYGQVTSQVESFQKFLTNINFFENENFSILQYANNVDVLFANKTSQYFLENARNIMTKDLENIMSVGTDTKESDNNSTFGDVPSTDEYLIVFAKAFHSSPFLFPRCAVSKSTQELLDLVVVMMEQASQASEVCAKRLYYTARNVFELYMAIVPLHFKTILERMPQQVALFHNNCMYLAHFLLTLGPRWVKQLQNKEIDYTISFCDQVKELRDLAVEKLLCHMRLQRKQVYDTIRSSDINYIATKDVLGENAEQSIRQCLRQLQLLKTIWIGIFPPNVYKRLITCLANIFIEELISKVLIQEDITADVASQLSEIYKIVLNRLPQVYQDELEIHSNVSLWEKFNELILVLRGTLADIEERWFNGLGPLAIHFKPEDLKRLIRALFQNTAYRANILSKIK